MFKPLYNKSLDAACQGNWNQPKVIEGQAYILVRGHFKSDHIEGYLQQLKQGANTYRMFELNQDLLEQLLAMQIKLQLAGSVKLVMTERQQALAERYIAADKCDLFGFYVIYLEPASKPIIHDDTPSI